MNRATGAMTSKIERGITWLQCPVCRRGKLLKLAPDTRASGLILYCRDCKHEVTVTIGADVCREVRRRSVTAVS